jgi:hypothetical protein
MRAERQTRRARMARLRTNTLPDFKLGLKSNHHGEQVAKHSKRWKFLGLESNSSTPNR